MPTQTTTPPTLLSKAPKPVPEWAAKVKAYREAAGKTQVETRNAIKAKINTMSLVERGVREFTAAERKLFFEFIGKPEDPSIPCKVRGPKAKGLKKAAKSAKAGSKKMRKGAKPAKAAKVAKAPKIEKAPEVSMALPVVPAAPDLKAATPTPVAANRAQAPVAPKPTRRPGRKPSKVITAKAMPQVVEKIATVELPKPARKPPTPKSVKLAALPSAPTHPASRSTASPVKEAVLSDISRILSNPGLSDNHAKRLHNLFTSLAVNALLGE